MTVERLSSLQALPAAAWRPVEAPDFPFADYEFLRALETSGSVGGRSGWTPLYLVCRQDNRVAGALCLYLKTNSYGEYIFDWDWARAYQRVGLDYYPKLVAAVPFTPATGPKLLVAPDADRTRVVHELFEAMLAVYDESKVSSAHALFLTERETAEFAARGFAIRHSSQFHWRNRGFGDFGDFLAALSGKRRRQIERERRQVPPGLKIERLTGAALGPQHAAAMTAFYEATTDKKDAIAYLGPDFFATVFGAMADRVLLVLATEGGVAVAAALNFFKGAHLFGRYWGATEEHRNLHFELCYYQTIEFAIERRMTLFEAGAQGEHKMQRGFLPSLTYSAHRIRQHEFRQAIESYIATERELLAESFKAYAEHSPFKS